jgi:hypothetical protein
MIALTRSSHLVPVRVLITQSTHPAYWNKDQRHSKCNVCLAVYTCKPPTRSELMESFTGPEIASLIAVDCIIAASPAFCTAIEGESSYVRMLSGSEHWDRVSELYTLCDFISHVLTFFVYMYSLSPCSALASLPSSLLGCIFDS